MSDAVVVFARYPAPGAVKTRLAADIGDDAATAFYKSCAEHLFVELDTLPRSTARYLFYDGSADLPALQRWTRDRFILNAQIDGDLGERMKRAFDNVFVLGATKCALVGTDIPNLTAQHISRAFALLDSCDVVLGPARDGGYYLIAMNAPRDVFSGIVFGTATVADETRSRIQALGCSLEELDVLDDVDDIAAYERRRL